MIELWWSEAGKYGVLPLDDREWERAAERLKTNPKTHYEYFGDMARIDRLSAPDISERSYVVTANFDAVEDVEGIILAWGSRFGGFVLYIKDRQLSYEVRVFGIREEYGFRRFSKAPWQEGNPTEVRACGHAWWPGASCC
jgi:arylsulfatase